MSQKLSKFFEKLESSGGFVLYFVVYTGVFLLFFFAMSLGFLMSGKGFLWIVDGLEQQYPFFAYQGEWLRQVFHSLLAGEDLPVWSMDIGYGSDVLLSLFASFGDPINLLSVFVPMRYADIMLCFTVVLRLYLAGLVFSAYCLYKGHDCLSVLIGAMVYSFSGYTTLAFTQIFMLYPLVVGPLVLWGVDKVFAKESPTLFVVSIALCFLKSVTHAYAVCLLLLVYCLLRYAYLDEEKTIRSFLRWFFKILSYILVGAAIGAILFIPSALAVLGESRLDLERSNGLLYSPSYYISLFLGIVSRVEVGADCFTGFASLALFSLFALFGRKSCDSQDKTLKMMFVIMTLFLCFPFVGKLFNGFAYPNNRWVWAYSLCVAYIVVATLPRLGQMTKTQKKLVLACVVLYGAVSVLVLLPFVGKEALVGLALLLLLAAVFCFNNEPVLTSHRQKILALASVFVCVAFSFGNYGSTLIQSGGGQQASKQVGVGKAFSILVTDSPSAAISEIESQADDDPFSRYDGVGYPSYRNENLVQQLGAISFYSSYYNSLIDEYHSSLGLASSPFNFSYQGLDSRVSLEALAGVDYFIAPLDDTSLLPENYSELLSVVEKNGNKYGVYGAKATLPVSCFYDEAIALNVYEELSMAEREQALLQGVVLEEIPESMNAAELHFTDEDLEWNLITENEGTALEDSKDTDQEIIFDGNTVTVLGGSAQLSLSVKVPEGLVPYISIEGLSYSDLPPSERISEDAWGDLSLYSKQDILLDDFLHGANVTETTVCLSMGSVTKTLICQTDENHLFGGKEDWLVNMGASSAGDMELVIEFAKPGVYSIDDINIVAVSPDSLVEDIEKLSGTSEMIEDPSFSGSTLTLSTSEDSKGGFLYIAIPYSDGWTAYVDGEPAEISRANIAFMGLELKEGLHEVVLKYETPGLKAGIAVSIVGVLIFLGVRLMRLRGDKAISGTEN